MINLYLVDGSGSIVSVASVSQGYVIEFSNNNEGYCELIGELIEPFECYQAVDGMLELKDGWQKIKHSLCNYKLDEMIEE